MQDGVGARLDGQRMPSLARAAFDALVRAQAERLLELALRAEADDYVERHRDLRDAAGKALVVRNGLATERHVATMAGTLLIRAPRVLDRRPGESFVSAILPPYARTSQRLAAALPELALRGLGAGPIASGEAVVRALVGPAAAGLSDGIAQRLDGSWAAECRAWLERRLDGMRFTEVWAGRVSEGGTCSYRAGCLAMVGMTVGGAIEVMTVGHGFADDVGWWQGALRDLAGRGLGGPTMVTGDQDLGIWHALDAVYPTTLQLPCSWHLVVDRSAGWQPSEVGARQGGGPSGGPEGSPEGMLDGASGGTSEGTPVRGTVAASADPSGSPGRGQAIDAGGADPVGVDHGVPTRTSDVDRDAPTRPARANRSAPSRSACTVRLSNASRWARSAATHATRISSTSTPPRRAMRASPRQLHAHKPAQSLAQAGRRGRDLCPGRSMSWSCYAATA